MARLTLPRRQVLAGALLSGCGRTGTPARVSVRKAASYSIDLVAILRDLLRTHNVDVRDKVVVLKPNLVEFDPATPINTNPALVLAALEAFRAEGAKQVHIAEGPGHRRPTLDLSEAAGYFEHIRGFEYLFTDLNWADVEKVPVPKPNATLKDIYLPKLIRHCDLLVSMPKMKTHHWVGATLSLKNFFGLLPGAIYGWPKNPLHWNGITESIADIYQTLPKTFAIVDGIDGMEGNGPIQGARKHAGVIVAGSDLPGVDATCCRIMGIDPDLISYLGLVPMPAKIEHLGEDPRSVRTDFALIPEFHSIRLAANA